MKKILQKSLLTKIKSQSCKFWKDVLNELKHNDAKASVMLTSKSLILSAFFQDHDLKTLQTISSRFPKMHWTLSRYLNLIGRLLFISKHATPVSKEEKTRKSELKCSPRLRIDSGRVGRNQKLSARKFWWFRKSKNFKKHHLHGDVGNKALWWCYHVAAPWNLKVFYLP